MKRTNLLVIAFLMMPALIACSGIDTKTTAAPVVDKTLVANGYSRFADNGQFAVNQRWLTAQQLAKLNAYRELAAQLYRELLDDYTTVGSQVMRDEAYRVYTDTYLREARVIDYRTVKDTLKTTVELKLTPRFYQCMGGDVEQVNQCLSEENKLAFTRIGYKEAVITKVNLACSNSDCSDQFYVKGFSKDRDDIDDKLLDVGLYDSEWMIHTGINLFLINGIINGF